MDTSWAGGLSLSWGCTGKGSRKTTVRDCGEYSQGTVVRNGAFGVQPPTRLIQSPSPHPVLTVFPKWESKNTRTKQSVNF